MKNRWRKVGHIFSPTGGSTWMRSHAAVPIAEHIDGDLFKIYFSSRNERNQSITGFVILDITKPGEILEISPDPVIAPGKLGEFDDSGAMATWLARRGDQRWLYYIGWNLGITVPFRNSIGLSISENGGEFVRQFAGPIVDRTMTEPHFVASCCVIPGIDKWRMWYLSCTGWQVSAGKAEHRYHIKYAESHDGINWDRDGTIAIDYANDGEYAISRPSVIHDEDCWKMWFSHRGSAYRIGYAESYDGINWTRLDGDCIIDVSVSGWDSEMIEYPYVFDHLGSRYMLYNGNEYGMTGFGLAVLEH